LSNSLTPLLFESNAKKIFQCLKDKYGYVVTPSGGDLSDKLLRIGHMGNLSEEDFDALLAAILDVKEKV